MSRSRIDLRSENGNIMLLGIGFIGICLLALAVITDASSAFIQQRNLQSWADSIALAGVQGIDLAQYYENGATESTRLDPSSVATLVNDHYEAHANNARPEEVPAINFTTSPTGVYVTVTAPLRLTFFDAVAFSPIEVSASARLDYRSQ